ncbi:Hypothetical protein PHPALM_13695 [Phytophthora palmivora]|uniref:Uncharacterized protein n=1 Tax=Phytophthora palmivora TaxID=4796 RepID=A0A2P4XWL7_9STRA|nr:Hypothetical protein PHPALM_13695 [Phytophthora palmivora]
MEGTDGFEIGRTPNLVLDSTREVGVFIAVSPSQIPEAGNATDDHEVTAKDVREACVSSRTQQAYRGSLRALSKWIIEIKKNEASANFDKTGEIELTRFTPADFEAFLLEKRKNYRSALKDLYRRKEVPIPVAYDKVWLHFSQASSVCKLLSFRPALQRIRKGSVAIFTLPAVVQDDTRETGYWVCSFLLNYSVELNVSLGVGANVVYTTF